MVEQSGTINELFGLPIIEDCTVKELRLPTAVIELLKGIDKW